MDENERKREAIADLCRRVFAEKTGLPADPQARDKGKTILQAADEAMRDEN